jgi:hypothetical protein
MDVDVLSHSGAGTFAAWTVNVGGTPALTSVVWGDILGTLGDQSDLAGALNSKLETTTAASTYLTIVDAASTYYLASNPSGFITSSALTGYATESWVTSGFYPLTGNPSGFIDASYLSGYAALTGADFTGRVTIASVAGGPPNFNIGNVSGVTGMVDGDIWKDIAGLHYYDGSDKLLATETFVTSQGYLTDAPSDGNQYARKDGAWDVVSAGGSYITSVTTPLAVTSGDLSIDLSAYATESFVTSQGYASLSGSTFTGPLITSGQYFFDSNSYNGFNIPLQNDNSSIINQGDLWMVGVTTNKFRYSIAGGSTFENIASESWVTSQGYITSAPVTSVAGRTGAITLAVTDVSGAAALSGATFTGLVSTPASTTTTAGLRLPHGTAPAAPVNGDLFTTTGGLFARINGVTRQYVDLDGTQTISGAKTFSGNNLTFGNSALSGTVNICSGAITGGLGRTINIGTNGGPSSTTGINMGSLSTDTIGFTGNSSFNGRVLLGIHSTTGSINFNGLNTADATAPVAGDMWYRGTGGGNQITGFTNSMRGAVTAVRAFVCFNGTGTPALRSNFNVSSITDNGVGDYTINFTNAMVDANYATLATTMRVTGNTGGECFLRETTTPTASLVRIGTTNQAGTAQDPTFVSVAILR